MKKNYITPNTEMTTLASMGLMEGIGFATNAASCATPASAVTITDETRID